MWWSVGLLLQKVPIRLFPLLITMKDKDFNRAVRLTRVKVWLQKRFWRLINSRLEISSKDYICFINEKVVRYAAVMRHIDKELGNVIWLEGYKKKQKLEE